MPSGNLLKPQMKTVIATNTVVATGASTAFALPMADAYTFYIAFGTVSGTSPTFDGLFQTSVDGGTTYVNVPWRFGQHTASTTNSMLTVRMGLGIGEVGNADLCATTGGILSKPAVVDPNFMKLGYTIGGSTPSFAFTLYLIALPKGSQAGM